MKITKSQLKQLIKEELESQEESLLLEFNPDFGAEMHDYLGELWVMMNRIAGRQGVLHQRARAGGVDFMKIRTWMEDIKEMQRRIKRAL